MNKLFYFVLLLTCSLFSQPDNILFIHPNGPKYKKVELGIKSELSNTVRILSLVSKNETDIKNSIDNNSPKVVIVASLEMIKVWKKLQQKYAETSQIASIFVESEYSENQLCDKLNCCAITCETKLAQYIKNVNHLTGKRPLNIGVIYSSKSANIAKSYQKECLALNVTLYDKQVIAADPETSIKTIVKNLTDHYNVDFMLILDDPITINNQNINTTWVSLLSGLNIPVAVPADYFYEIEPRIGSLAIQPHYSAIGSVIASVINGAEANNWNIIQKHIHTDKSILYSRNRDGSISKQNQVQNDIIASYHPKREVIPVQPQTPVEKQQNTLSDNIAIAAAEESPRGNTEEPVEPEIEIKKPVQAKQVTNNEKSDNTRGKKEKAPVLPLVNKETKKPVPDQIASTGTKHISQNTNLPSNPASVHTTVDTQRYLSKSDPIQHSQTKDQVSFFQHKVFLIIVIFFVLIAVAIVVYVLLKSKKVFRSDKDKNNCLLIANTKKRIKYSDLMDTSTTLTKYLKNCGFNILLSKYLDQISDLLLFNLPEVICIDWQFDSDIQRKFYKVLKDQMFSAEFILIFYNVTESSEINIGYYEDRTFYLKTDFTILDLNKILSIVKKRARLPRLSDDKANPQLEGKIMEDTLSEIFQMMDINKKTGCLIVETDHPAGMVFFEDGTITYSISNSQIAEPAIFEILEMKSGRFHFIPGKKPLSRQMQASVVAILMEQAKYTDEFETAQIN